MMTKEDFKGLNELTALRDFYMSNGEKRLIKGLKYKIVNVSSSEVIINNRVRHHSFSFESLENEFSGLFNPLAENRKNKIKNINDNM